MTLILNSLLGLVIMIAATDTALAQNKYKEWDVVYDNITRSVLEVDYYKNGTIYLKNPAASEPWYSLPRNESDLVPRVKALGGVQEGSHITFFNPSLKRWDQEKVQFLFANRLAYIHLVTYEASIVDNYYFVPIQLLGIEVASIPGSDLKAGSRACPRTQTPRGRRAGSTGTVTKLFSNNTAILMYKDLFFQTNYEAIPLSNLTTTCKKK